VIVERAYQLWPPSVVVSRGTIIEVNTGWNGATLVFPMQALGGSCRSRVELWLFAVGGGRGRGPIGVYASRLFDLLRGPDQFPRGKTLLSARPRWVRSLDGRTKGWVVWDITSILVGWVPRQPFGDSGLVPPVGGPFVLEMRSVTNPVYAPTVLWRFSSATGDTALRPRLVFPACPMRSPRLLGLPG